MSTRKEIKKIDLDTLNVAERKVFSSNIRKALIILCVGVLIAAVGYSAYRLVLGEVIASRFTVLNMNCPACTVTLDEIATRLPGVVDTRVSLAGQEVVVKYHANKINPETIRDAMTRAGYPAISDGSFKPDVNKGIAEPVIATINGKPLFEKDLKTPLHLPGVVPQEPSLASAFFSAVGKELILQAADLQLVVVQPAEINEEVMKVIRETNQSPEAFWATMSTHFGSKEKYLQVVAQRIGIRRFLNEHVLQGITNPTEKSRRTLEWIGDLFKKADVQILDPGMRDKLRSAVGEDEWKSFWPRMLAQDTEFKKLLEN